MKTLLLLFIVLFVPSAFAEGPGRFEITTSPRYSYDIASVKTALLASLQDFNSILPDEGCTLSGTMKINYTEGGVTGVSFGSIVGEVKCDDDIKSFTVQTLPSRSAFDSDKIVIAVKNNGRIGRTRDYHFVGTSLQ